MSINPIELLKQKVSSVIVNDQTCLINEKMPSYQDSTQFS